MRVGGRVHYELARYEGLLGNRKEASWNRELMQHDCCGAKVSWRHKVTCPDRQPAEAMS